ncbi:MAG: hypothetical protein WDA71_06770 [Actinomycetota bacterium]
MSLPPQEAVSLVGRLEADGIPCLPKGNIWNNPYGLTFGEMGRVQLLVPAEYVARARRLMALYDEGVARQALERRGTDDESELLDYEGENREAVEAETCEMNAGLDEAQRGWTPTAEDFEEPDVALDEDEIEEAAERAEREDFAANRAMVRLAPTATLVAAMIAGGVALVAWVIHEILARGLWRP